MCVCVCVCVYVGIRVRRLGWQGNMNALCTHTCPWGAMRIIQKQIPFAEPSVGVEYAIPLLSSPVHNVIDRHYMYCT